MKTLTFYLIGCSLVLSFVSVSYCGDLDPNTYSFALYELECKEYINNFKQMSLYLAFDNVSKKVDNYTSLDKKWKKEESRNLKHFEISLKEEAFIETLNQIEVQSALEFRSSNKLVLSYQNEDQKTCLTFNWKF